ncbi:glycosyltransferase [uncultured Pseudoramibacter sp.]|uniref:glycosyltransferase n=1 Tax=uncultured Pseudoramibacter sp. TaxID=1623493 RepID=UPI0025D8AC3F|nr:glycosyltransferase [uncultured Pseudoramibacter sp.]
MNIGIVLVTFNRLEKLKIAIQHYEAQIFKPAFILIVDNCSSDGTKEYLDRWKAEPAEIKRHVIHLDSNTGGAGGFYAGMQEALKLSSDWIWVSDDDAYPRRNALKNLKDYYQGLTPEKQNEIAALCCAVYNQGKVHEWHRNHMKQTKLKVKIFPSTAEEYQKKAFPIEIFSYVGAMIKSSVLKKVGLDRKEFFIYCDDQEHSIRIAREGKIFCVPSAIIDHDTPPFDRKVINWGRYYKVRNDLLMIKYNFPKRYYFFRYWRRYLRDASIFSKNPPVLKKELKAAYRDAANNRAGIHPIYKPGWQPEK